MADFVLPKDLLNRKKWVRLFEDAMSEDDFKTFRNEKHDGGWDWDNIYSFSQFGLMRQYFENTLQIDPMDIDGIVNKFRAIKHYRTYGDFTEFTDQDGREFIRIKRSQIEGSEVMMKAIDTTNNTEIKVENKNSKTKTYISGASMVSLLSTLLTGLSTVLQYGLIHSLDYILPGTTAIRHVIKWICVAIAPTTVFIIFLICKIAWNPIVACCDLYCACLWCKCCNKIVFCCGQCVKSVSWCYSVKEKLSSGELESLLSSEKSKVRDSSASLLSVASTNDDSGQEKHSTEENDSIKATGKSYNNITDTMEKLLTSSTTAISTTAQHLIADAFNAVDISHHSSETKMLHKAGKYVSMCVAPLVVFIVLKIGTQLYKYIKNKASG